MGACMFWVGTDGITAYMPGGELRRVPAETGDYSTVTLASIVGWADDRSADGQATVIIAADLARRLSIPDRPALLRLVDPPVEQLAACGWTLGTVQPFTLLRRGSRIIALGVEHWIEPNRCPLLADTPDQTVTRFGRWFDLTGTIYRGTPGIAAVAMIRDHYEPVNAVPDKSRKVPTWLPGEATMLRRQTGNAEDDYRAGIWQRSGPEQYEHGYDLRTMYLTAAGIADLPWWSLRKQGDPTPNPKHAGYHLIRPEPWTLNHLLPSPVGRDRGIPSQDAAGRWVTTPTLRLLDELREQGIFGGYELIETWSADAGRVLRPWSERIRDAIAWVDPEAGAPPERADRHLTAALKDGYREAIGLLGREGGRVFRPEWRHIIIATARANLWRRLWRTGRETDRWPLRIDVDCAWYGSNDPDPARDAPLPLGITPGRFRCKSTINHARTESVNA